MSTYKRHRFPPDIISYAVWLYYRFNPSYRDIEDLLAKYKQYKSGIRKKSTRATRIFDPKMTLNHP